MGAARWIMLSLLALFALAMLAAAVWLWPLLSKTDFAYIEYVRRDLPFGWLLLQAALPLFVLSIINAIGAGVMVWRLSRAPRS